MCRVLRAACCVLGAALGVGVFGAVTPRAQVAMPDPSQMSGVPLPAGELPIGTLTVRVVRGSLSNNLPDQPVELTVNGARRQARTDASGRAEFNGLRPGDQVRASTTVDGTPVTSQVITMPSQGGIRVMLVVGQVSEAGQAGTAPTSPTQLAEPMEPVPGAVVFGGESRFIVERGDEALNVFYVLEILNTARAPVSPPAPLVFDLPSGAVSASLLPGSTPQATVSGSRVTVTGPFAPGVTPLQIGYELPYRGSRATVTQELPAPLPQLAAAGETTGGVTMTSPLFAASREMNAEGRTYLVGNGPGLAAGGTLTLMFDGLPHHPRWPRFAALGVAVAILIGGFVFAFAPGGRSQAPADDPVAMRESHLDAVAILERRRAAGEIDEEAFERERERLMSALEEIYTRGNVHAPSA